jgi:F1F0 ATPase subunit 2
MAMDAQAHMISNILPLALQALAGLAAGLLLGLVHFRSLRRVSNAYVDGHAARAAALQIARMAIMIAVLFALARVGALCLLAGAGGVLLGRRLVMRGMKEETP